MYKKYLVSFVCWHWSMAGAQDLGSASALTERDFLSEMPIVLSVSRLAQRLDETPGAVTILDRNFIRMSGARDVVDLLRVVPGFQTTTTFETEAPMASYHGRSDDWANRIQVLVDGRSVYSGHLQGSAGLGLQTLAMDDIERIEVLRGSNSAAYGARAFLGVVNIISRDVRETGGSMGSITAGDNRVADASARVGWGEPDAMYRISVDTRGDAGLRGAYGENRISRANFSAHVARDGGVDVDVRAGGVNIDAGHGSRDAGQYGNPARMRFLGSQFLQVDWRKALAEDEDIAVSVSHTENTFRDSFPYLDPAPGLASFYGVIVDFGGREFNDALTLQHTMRHSTAVRTVWGGEVRREKLVSPSSFDARGEVTTDFYRAFGNLEWRLRPAWILNAGAMVEHSDMVGNSVAPRVMLNWHAAEGHTFRAGASTAFRPPSTYEKYALARYYPVAGAPPVPPITTFQSSGNVTSERIYAQELGYQWRLGDWRLEGDLRVFNEQITDGIKTDGTPLDARNMDSYCISGAEMQLNWKLMAATQLYLTQSWTDVSGTLEPSDITDSHPYRVAHASARYAASLMLMHTLPSGIDVSLIYNRFDDIGLMSGEKNQTYSGGRADLRIAKGFKLGKSRGDIALTVQSLDTPYQDGNRKFFFDPRAMLTLRFEN